MTTAAELTARLTELRAEVRDSARARRVIASTRYALRLLDLRLAAEGIAILETLPKK